MQPMSFARFRVGPIHHVTTNVVQDPSRFRHPNLPARSRTLLQQQRNLSIALSKGLAPAPNGMTPTPQPLRRVEAVPPVPEVSERSCLVLHHSVSKAAVRAPPP